MANREKETNELLELDGEIESINESHLFEVTEGLDLPY